MGINDENTIFDSIKDYWPAIQEKLAQLPEDEKDAFREHFNSLFEDISDLGDIMFDEQNKMHDKIDLIDSNDVHTFTQELYSKEILDARD